jgi:hypothetical protein
MNAFRHPAGRRLWSLWDMLQLNSVAFIRALLGIASLNGGLVGAKVGMRVVGTPLDDNSPVPPEHSQSIKQELLILIEVLKELEAPTTLKGAQRLENRLDDPTLTFEGLFFLMNHMIVSFKDEFGAQTFLSLSHAEARLFLATEPPFGKEVEEKFPATVSEDIIEASKCMACARYTASTFHLMRVLEFGVSKFAGKLGVSLLNSRGKDKNWHNFLEEANKAIGLLPSQDKTTKQYAAISANLYNVKIAWRNEVMHPKQTYTEEQALNVFAATKAFMSELASVL